MNRLLRSVALAACAILVVVGGAGVAGAVHAGESITLSQNTGLSDGDVVRVTVSGFTPNANPVKLVIAGQGELVTIPDKLNFDEYAVAPEVPIAADGTGSADFIVTSDHGVVQDGTTLDCLVDRCWIIAVQEPFLPQPNYASEEVFFGENAPPTTAAPTTEAPTTEAPTTEAPTTEAPTTTEATTTTTEVEEEAIVDQEDSDEGGSALLWVILAAAVIAIGGAGYYFTRKKPAEDEPLDGTPTSPTPPAGPPPAS